ncbi:MAG TPA: type I glyceraldehyde-3-phosphate dehydrogenase [Candidatus Paceibacterota bacterium]|nr:type I glyceraldehyde-3-phosphate dehydrogenase [Candidatus Paceibacterota bacterium]
MKIAINGLGRIGRAFLKNAITRDGVEISAVNDLGDLENLAYLLKYDTAYGVSDFDVHVEDEGEVKHLVVGGRKIRFLSVRDPEELPWRDFGIDVVLESTGFFTHYEDAQKHLRAGAKKVVISAPAKGTPVDGVEAGTVLMGINEGKLSEYQISSNASCTTNSSSPLIQILHEAIGIEKALLTTIHGYTATQKIVDAPDKKDYRRGRAAAMNIIPTSTGAAVAVTQVVTDLQDKFDGIAMRVPVVVGSISDITFIAKRNTSAEEVNEIFRKAAGEDRWKKTFAVTDEPLVSSDIIGNTHASIADLGLTRVVDGNLVKVCAWYDNEWGYTNSLVEHVLIAGSHLS